jgi:thioesterase domain-containing protein
MSTQQRIRDLSETKQLALRRLLENKDIGTERILSLEGSNLKLLRPGWPNLYIYPATDGNVAYMLSYLPFIPQSWGVYACQTPGLEGEQVPYNSVPELAAHSLRFIRKVQPAGPYYLAGNCMGGVPAFETARQLHELGEQTPLVLHLMPNFDRPWCELPGVESLQLRGLIDYIYIIERLLTVRLDVPMAELAELAEARRIDFLVERIERLGVLRGMDLDMFRRRVDTYLANLEAMFRYEPPDGYDGPLTILSVGEQRFGESVVHPSSPYAAAIRAVHPQRLDVVHVDADGGALFDGSQPHMSRIGAAMLKILESAGTRG